MVQVLPLLRQRHNAALGLLYKPHLALGKFKFDTPGVSTRGKRLRNSEVHSVLTANACVSLWNENVIFAGFNHSFVEHGWSIVHRSNK